MQNWGIENGIVITKYRIVSTPTKGWGGRNHVIVKDGTLHNTDRIIRSDRTAESIAAPEADDFAERRFFVFREVIVRHALNGVDRCREKSNEEEIAKKLFHDFSYFIRSNLRV